MSEPSAEDAIAVAHRAALRTLRDKAMAWVEALHPQATQIPPGQIAKNDGVIDAFNIAAQIVLRVIEKEREAHGLAAASDISQLPDEQELERLISAELDRIAAATGQATLGQADGADAPAAGSTALGLANLERAA